MNNLKQSHKMGRDIYAFIERRRKNGKWECLADDEKIMDNYFLYRSPTLFGYLSYNSYKREKGISQRPLSDWVTTLSPEANRHMYMRIKKSLDNCPWLFDRKDFDYEDVLESLNSEDPVEEDDAIWWINKGVSFLLTDDIISNPDTCYWNWCTADELEWAVKETYMDNHHKPSKDDDYLRIVELMRNSEAEGYEVRIVYSYDNSSKWLNCCNQDIKSEDNSESQDEKNNYLLMFILQNQFDNLKDAIDSQNNRCYFGIFSLYQVAYANKILLSDPSWGEKFLPIVKKSRIENNKILKYLASLIKIPEDFSSEFARFLKRFGWSEEDLSFEMLFNDSLDVLLDKGYREIDCLLYEAGARFDFDRMIDLLNQGGNPLVHISGDYTPEEAAILGPDQVNSLCVDAFLYASHFCSNGIYKCWENGINDKETFISNKFLHNVFIATGYQLILNIINYYARKNQTN
jgi:hypothetical protein